MRRDAEGYLQHRQEGQNGRRKGANRHRQCANCTQLILSIITNFKSSRWKESSSGNEKDHATNGGRRRRRKAFIISPVLADGRVANTITGRQLRECLRNWQSPPDPSTNHKIACESQHERTTKWFCQGSVFEEWKCGRIPVVDPRETYVPHTLDSVGDLIVCSVCSGLWKEHPMVSTPPLSQH